MNAHKLANDDHESNTYAHNYNINKKKECLPYASLYLYLYLLDTCTLLHDISLTLFLKYMSIA